MARTKVQSELIATNAISGTIIADGAITSTHLAANCVDSSELVTGSIDTIHIAANQVTATKIVTNGVLTRHISDDQITADKLANSINTDIATGVTANTTANAALPKAGGTLTGALTTNGVINTGTSHNFALNTPNSLRINIDSNNSATDQIFVIGHNQTSVDNNNALMTILESGNVGIGTSSPATGLHVVTGGGTTPFRVQGGANSGVNIMEVGFAGGGAGANFIVDDNGRVGIGEDDPQTKLHVYGTNPVIRVSDDGTSGYSTLELRQQNTANEGSELMYNSGTGHTHLNTVYDADLKIATNTGSFGTTSTNTRLTVKNDGVIEVGKSNVGTDRIKFMGTTNVGAPNTSNHDTGTRLSLYDSDANSWYAIGIESNHMWFNADGGIFKFYQQAVQKIHFDGTNPMPIIRCGTDATNAMRLGSVTAVIPYSGPTFIRAVASASYTVHDGTNSAGSWLDLNSSFPDFLVGLASINTINTSQQANIIFYLNTATKVYMTRNPGWNAVSTTGWDRISDRTDILSDGSTNRVYVRWLQAGTHSLDNDSALYFFEAPHGA